MPENDHGHWVMPEWMEFYRPMIRWTEGHTVEWVLSHYRVEALPLWRNRAVMAQVQLLEELHNKGMLTPTN